MNHRRSFLLVSLVLLLAPSLAPSPALATRRPAVLSETGSTLLYPLFNLWAARYTRLDHDVRITTEATGSGTGIAQALAGLVSLGASDAYLSKNERRWFITGLRSDVGGRTAEAYGRFMTVL